MNDPKQAMLDAINAEWSKPDNRHAPMWVTTDGRAFVRDIAKQLGAAGPDDYLEIVTAWHDLHRSGVLAYGYQQIVQERDDGRGHLFGTVHTTRLAKKVLEHVRRDPSNPVAYLEHVDVAVPKGSIARSYLEEALQTYNAGCDKATAVLVGCASEALVLELRDALAAKYVAPKKLPSPLDPTQWKMRTIIDGIHDVLGVAKKNRQIPHDLGEQFAFRWTSVVDMIRRPRNEVGHPTDITPIGRSDVHALLLIFPETAKLTRDLIDWACTAFVP